MPAAAGMTPGHSVIPANAGITMPGWAPYNDENRPDDFRAPIQLCHAGGIFFSLRTVSYNEKNPS